MQNMELHSFVTPDHLAEAAARAWLAEVQAANAAGKPHLVALSGGRITQKFFAAIVALVRQTGTPGLANVHFFWADERCVPPDDAESNYAMAEQLLFQPLTIKADKIHRLRGELPPPEAAALAVEEIRQVAPLTAAGQPVLDVIFLGMGEDGHVASLFPQEPEADRANPAIFRAIAQSPKPPPNRITLGYPAIAAAREVWVLVSGSGKETAWRETLSPTGKTPLARVLQSRTQSRIFTDLK